MQKKSELQWTAEMEASFEKSISTMFGKRLSKVQYEDWDDEVSGDDETERE